MHTQILQKIIQSLNEKSFRITEIHTLHDTTTITFCINDINETLYQIFVYTENHLSDISLYKLNEKSYIFGEDLLNTNTINDLINTIQ